MCALCGMGVSWVVAMAINIIMEYREGGFFFSLSCFNAVMRRRPDDWKWMKFYMCEYNRSEWTNGEGNEWVNERTNKWMVGWLAGWMNEWMPRPCGMCQAKKGTETGPRGRLNMLPIFNSWEGSGGGGGCGVEAGEEATTPPAVATSLQPQTPFVPASSCLPPATFFLLLLHLLLLLQYKTQIRFGCRLMRNLYAAQTVGHFFCFLFSPPPSAPPSRFRFRLGFVWPRQLALEEITIKLNGIQSYTTLETTQEIRNASMTLLILWTNPLPIHPWLAQWGHSCFLTLSVHKFFFLGILLT